MYRYCNLKELSERFESDQENNQEFFSPRFINKVELYTLQLNTVSEGFVLSLANWSW